jgi:molybdopterin synthase catalytic subunit
LNEAVDYIKKEQPFDPAEYAERRKQYMEERNQNNPGYESNGSGSFKEVSFDDLG